MIRAIDLCEIVGSPLLHVCPGWGFYDRADGLKIAWDNARDAMREIGLAAQERGVALALEPLQIVESNLVGDIPSARRMLDEVDLPNMKLLVDTCHMAVKGEDLDDYFRAFGKDIVHIHLNESSQVPWGYGDLPLEKYIAQLEANDFSGTITLEICSRKFYIDPNRAFARAWRPFAGRLKKVRNKHVDIQRAVWNDETDHCPAASARTSGRSGYDAKGGLEALTEAARRELLALQKGGVDAFCFPMSSAFRIWTIWTPSLRQPWDTSSAG